jgi:hypothetical protein
LRVLSTGSCPRVSLSPSLKRTHSYENLLRYNITLHLDHQGIGGEKVLFFHPLLRS